jgi:hypothetical protein
MTFRIVSNRKNQSAVLHFTANATVIVAGNSSQSNIAMSDEVLTGASIVQAYWGTDGSGHIHIHRGANCVATYDSTGYKDYAGCGMALTLDATANIVVEMHGSNNYLMIEVQKAGNFNNAPYNIT